MATTKHLNTIENGSFSSLVAKEAFVTGDLYCHDGQRGGSSFSPRLGQLFFILASPWETHFANKRKKVRLGHPSWWGLRLWGWRQAASSATKVNRGKKNYWSRSKNANAPPIIKQTETSRTRVHTHTRICLFWVTTACWAYATMTWMPVYTSSAIKGQLSPKNKEV